MLFETQEAADRYIKYFREEEDDYFIAKSYYCAFCGGYHLTGNSSSYKTRWFDNRDERMLKKVDDIIKSKDDIEPVIRGVNEKIDNVIRPLIIQGLLVEAELALNACRKELRPFKHCEGRKYGKWLEEDKKIDLNLSNIACIRQLAKASVEEQEAFLTKEPVTEEELMNRKAFDNYMKLKAIKKLLNEIEDDVKNTRIEVLDKIPKCRFMVKSIPGYKKMQFLIDVRKRLVELDIIVSQHPNFKTYSKNTNNGLLKEGPEYTNVILNVIGKFEEIKAAFDEGKLEDCLTIFDEINNCLTRLQQNEDTLVLRNLYRSWKSIVKKKIWLEKQSE